MNTHAHRVTCTRVAHPSLNTRHTNTHNARSAQHLLAPFNVASHCRPLYLAAAQGAPVFDTSSVADFTKALLAWWRVNGGHFPAWALAARVAFAISPSSAACERVFALVKLMFGEQQMSALADMIQAALMLRSNGRRVG